MFTNFRKPFGILRILDDYAPVDFSNYLQMDVSWKGGFACSDGGDGNGGDDPMSIFLFYQR
jgi:hypothetical protein